MIGGIGVWASCRLGEMLFERVENRRVVAFEMDLDDPSSMSASRRSGPGIKFNRHLGLRVGFWDEFLWQIHY